MEEDATVITRGYGIDRDPDGTEYLTELTWYSDASSRVEVVRLRP